MQLSQITVPFQEWHDMGTTEDITPEMTQAVKKFKVAWTDRWPFYQQVVGRVTITGGLGGSIARVIPLQYPECPWLYAQEIHTEPNGRSVPGPLAQKYEEAIVSVVFKSVPWSFGAVDNPNQFYSGVYRHEAIEMSAEMMNLPGSAYKFQSNPGMPVLHPPGRIMPLATLTITQEMCPYIPYSAVFGSIGRVNSQLFYTAPPGTVLFMGCQTESQFGLNLDLTSRLQSQRIVCKFCYRDVEWNKALMPDGSGFDYLVNSSGDYIYPDTDLNSLFFDGSSAPR